MAAEDRAPEGVVRVRAANPSPLTLDGTNTYIVARWVVDPGPDDPSHLDALVEAARDGGIEGIALTHGHHNH
ncbi:MAG: MBL fold metallo-hydrolase, partial [Actinobacteria bacterium]|nr:MBL fold metallo-hydrolase [Actinomycetota bacterium]